MEKNQLIVGSKNSGKTTFLLSYVKYQIENNNSVIVLDSATQHKEKSLIMKILHDYKHVEVKDFCDVEDLFCMQNKLDTKIFFDYYSLGEIIIPDKKIICFDLSFYLEKGYDVYEKSKREKDFWYYRNIYRKLSWLVVSALLYLDSIQILNRTMIVMDEIDLSDEEMTILGSQKNINIVAAMHPQKQLAKFYQSFELIPLNKYGFLK
ncbi:MAG: hypothetical protein KF816_06575 [Melioribacteraceae bacterium]|nr:hypothetical protein [Melioribacteraceae bacterium]